MTAGHPQTPPGAPPLRLPALVWLLWALAAAASVQLAPNPLYVTAVIAIAALIVEGEASDGPLTGAFPVVLLAGVCFAGVRLVLTAATTHGTGDVLFRLPEATLPPILGGFTVGGTVEAPVVARAAAEGWAIVGMLAAFCAFNAVVSHYELVQAAPRAFYEVGLALTIAIAFVPSTVMAVGAVREADRARTGGRVVRRGRLLRQIVPILETGMERAVLLAESMDSRGFGHRRATRADALATAATAVALLALGAAVVALIGGASAIAGASAVVGAIGIVLAIAVASSGSARSRYRPHRLQRRDWVIGILPWAAPAALVVLTLRGNPTLVWPGAALAVPGIDLLAIAGLSALAVPALRGLRR